MARVRRLAADEQATTVAHLSELRDRLVVSTLAFVVAFAALYALHGRLLDLLEAPLPDRFGPVLTLSPAEPFLITLKVVAWAALIVSLPVVLYQAFAFLAPAVGSASRRAVALAALVASALFCAGVAFGFELVLPRSLSFLLGFDDRHFAVAVRAGDYLGFATTIVLLCGLAFELPTAMLALARLGVVDARRLRRARRYAVIGIAGISALMPGGDPFSMVLVMVPQLLLFEAGIVAVALGERRRRAAEPAAG